MPVFDAAFAEAVAVYVRMHHAVYADLPPQGIYFEKLVERAFKKIRKPFAFIESGGRNQPRHDLRVDDCRISLKTETGEGTRPDSITITKLCTTEREPWTADSLVERVMEHLARYDLIIMLRAIWHPGRFRYQLLEIPVALLRRIETTPFEPVGHRAGRQSLGADVRHEGSRLFHVHFDASDRKCSIRDLPVLLCDLLDKWNVRSEE